MEGKGKHLASKLNSGVVCSVFGGRKGTKRYSRNVAGSADKPYAGAKGAWLDGITESMDMNLGKLWEMVRDRKLRSAAVHRAAKSRIQLSD